jgi:hypothetical protein
LGGCGSAATASAVVASAARPRRTTDRLLLSHAGPLQQQLEGMPEREKGKRPCCHRGDGGGAVGRAPSGGSMGGAMFVIPRTSRHNCSGQPQRRLCCLHTESVCMSRELGTARCVDEAVQFSGVGTAVHGCVFPQHADLSPLGWLAGSFAGWTARPAAIPASPHSQTSLQTLDHPFAASPPAVCTPA